MEALVLLIIFGSIFGSIVANRVFKYRHIERMKELETGPALDDKRIDALVAFLKTLTDERYEHLLEE